MRTVFAVLFSIFIGFPPASAADEGVAACLACHPAKTSSPELRGVPLLAGQHPEYIVKQLERFAAADADDPYRRSDTLMAHVTGRIAKEDRQRIAEALSGQQCTLYGDPKLPTFTPNPCASCHGARGISATPDVPNLAGQDVRYMYYQYQKLREPYVSTIPGIEPRGGDTRLHPVMGPVSAHLSDSVVSILLYYSKLPCR